MTPKRREALIALMVIIALLLSFVAVLFALNPSRAALAETETVNVSDAGECLPGAQGAQGLTGIDGLDGVDGKDGVDGVDGVDGKDGVDGVDGKDGVDGLDGIDGKDGLDGLDGACGETGPPGPQGERGIDGISGLTIDSECAVLQNNGEVRIGTIQWHNSGNHPTLICQY
jgi:hypothetical protein